MTGNSNKKSILFVTSWNIDNTVGGVNGVVSALFDQFKKQNQLEPILVENDYQYRKPVCCHGKDDRALIKIRFLSPPSSIKSTISFFVFLPIMLARYINLFNQKKVEIINFHYPSTSVFIIALMKFLKLYHGKLVLSFHGTDVQNLKKMSRYNRLLWRFIFQHTDKVVACSYDLANILKNQVSVCERESICVAHNGIDHNDFIHRQAESAELSKVLAQKRYILSVGTFVKNKGHEVLIRNFAQISNIHPDLSLVIIGASGRDLAYFTSLSHKLGLTERVEFLVNVPNNKIGIYYSHAELFVHASRREAFCLVILEAGIYKLPVIASNVGGTPEILSDKINGRLFSENGQQPLSDIINEMLSDKEQATKFAQQLYLDIRHNFSWEKTYNTYLTSIYPATSQKNLN